jgi:hypothetical protein
MLRTVGGAVAGAVAWLVFVTAIGFMLGRLWPDLARAGRDPLTLTLPMLVTRLSVSFVASLLSGALAARLGASAMAALGSGVVLLLVWAPYHVTMIWHLFPVWYHLTFLASLPLLGWFGARFAPPRARAAAA